MRLRWHAVFLAGALLLSPAVWADGRDRGEHRREAQDRYYRGDDSGYYGDPGYYRNGKEWRKAQKERDKERRKAWREAQKDRREAEREWRKDQREREKDRREAERDWYKDRRDRDYRW